jgi:tRNA pseudouridine38-40 synthase
LNIDAMITASKYLIGTHDFSSFKSAGSIVKDNIRTIYKFDIIRNGENIEFYVHGDGFLYNMVRIIVGTLLEIGVGKKSPEYMDKVILSMNRKLAGKTAPAHGLCLMKVFYQ